MQPHDEEEIAIAVPLAEETATVGRREVVTGRVRVDTVTEWRTEDVEAQLGRDEVEVERIPVGRAVDQAPSVRTEGDVTIVPVVEERLVVETQLVLVEEVRIRRRTSTETVTVPVRLRRQHVEIERDTMQAGASTDEVEQ